MLYPDFKELMEIGYRASAINLTARRKTLSIISGDQKSPFRGRGLEFEEVRAYVPGDDVRNIDWRVTARTGIPYLKLFSEDRERSVLICIDKNDSMSFGTRQTFKSIQAARAAALIGWASVYENNPTGASFFGNVAEGMRFFGPRRSRRSLWRMIRTLCDTTSYYQQSIRLEDHLQYLTHATPSGALVFIISDFIAIGSNLRRSLTQLHNRADIILVAVNDPADIHLPNVGTVSFTNTQKERLVVNTSSENGSQAYHQTWLENRKLLREIATNLNLGLIQLYTNSDVWTDLTHGLRTIRKGGRKRAKHAVSAS